MSPIPVETVGREAQREDGVQAAPPDAASPQLAYDPESGRAGVTRRQFRFLLALTLVNTLMLGAFVAGPGLSRTVGGWWRDYKQWRAEREAGKRAKAIREQFLATYRKMLGHVEPAETVVYEEEPGRAAELAKRPGYAAIRRNRGFVYLTPRPWQFPVAAVSPAISYQTQLNSGAMGAPLFFGGRRMSSGQERLVVVALEADVSSASAGAREFPDLGEEQKKYRITTQRQILATSLYPHERDTGLQTGAGNHLLEVQRSSNQASLVTWSKTTSWENGRIDVRHGDVMRFFAGQADPADASRFSIKYELNGRVGWIDGRLLDDQTVALEPREGRIVKSDQSGRARTWDPHAEPATTRPGGER